MMKKTALTPAVISYFFILLFGYAAFSKLLEFETFQVQLAQSPLLSAYAGIVSYAVITIEVIAIALLSFNFTRLLGLYLSLALMSGFTIYIFLILNYSDFIPCSCGGILEKLGWTEHLIFNIVCIGLAVWGIMSFEKQKSGNLRKPIIYSVATSFVSCLIVVFLFITSEHIIKKENNFTRRFLQHPIIEDKSMNLGVNSFYFAGAHKDKIYLGNHTTPLYITEIDTILSKRQMIQITLDRMDHPFKSMLVKVNYPNVYLYDGTVPIIYQGNIQTQRAKTVSLKDTYFSQIIPIGGNRFSFRATSSKTKSQILGILDLNDDPKVKLFDNLLTQQKDGVFDMDGRLLFDSETQKIIYVYYYRNQILVMDDSLKLSQSLRTIDTTTQAKVTVKTTADGSTQMIAPPYRVNKNMAVYRNLLFNESNLMGRLESRSNWNNSSIVDIYRTDK